MSPVEVEDVHCGGSYRDVPCGGSYMGCSVMQKLVGAKSGPGGPLYAAKIGPTPDQFWLPKMVQVAKSGPGISACRKPFLACVGPFLYAATVNV